MQKKKEKRRKEQGLEVKRKLTKIDEGKKCRDLCVRDYVFRDWIII